MIDGRSCGVVMGAVTYSFMFVYHASRSIELVSLITMCFGSCLPWFSCITRAPVLLLWELKQMLGYNIVSCLCIFFKCPPKFSG